MSRIGLVFPGDVRDPLAWSGIPSRLYGALEALSVRVVAVNSEAPRILAAPVLNATALAYAFRSGVSSPAHALRRARWQARERPAGVRARTAFLNRRLRRVGEFDALIQIHAQCVPATTTPMATYEDLTVVQAIRHGYAEFEHMADSERQRRIALQGLVYERATACCTTSRWARQSIIDDYGVPAGRVHVVGIGADRTPGPHARDWTTPRFVFVGRDWRRKNGDAVLAAFARVRAATGCAELHLVGGHPRLAQEGVYPYGVLRPDVPAENEQVNELYRRATCFVMPSRVEPSAISYVEAAAFGIPSIGTTVGGSADLIGDGGLVVDPADDDGLFRAMLKLTDPEVAAALGAKARAHARLFTWPLVATRILTAVGVAGFDEPPTWVDGLVGDEPLPGQS